VPNNNNSTVVVDIISDHLVELLQTNDILLVLLATIGIFAILKAIFQVCGSVVFDIFKLFVIAPVILISALLDARKDPAKRGELKEIKDYIKTNPNVLKSTIIWFVFLLIILALAYQFMLMPQLEMAYITANITYGE